MPTRRVKLTFMDNLIRRPLLYEVTHLYDIVTNIHKAQITEDTGWVILDISGDTQSVNLAATWLCAEGVEVEYVH